MIDGMSLISLFLIFLFLITHKTDSLYIIVIQSIYWIRSIHILGFKAFHGENLKYCYQFDGKKIYDIITGVSYANTINS